MHLHPGDVQSRHTHLTLPTARRSTRYARRAISEAKLRALVRERIEHGALPILLVRALDEGYGHDGPCRACGEAVVWITI